MTAPPAAVCTAGPSPHSGKLQLSRGAYAVTEDGRTPMVLVTRSAGSRGEISASVRTSGGSAHSGQDFRPTTTRVTFGNGDTSPRLVEIPIREDAAVESQENFTVSLSHPQCGALGKQRRASVTILDDDQPPPPPAPTFTIGGTVDGLQGSGLVVTNRGADVPVSANGSFTFPGTASAGQAVRRRGQDPAEQPQAAVHGARRQGHGEQRERDRHRRALHDTPRAAGAGRVVRERRPRVDPGRRPGTG